jgi:hypothetical protein
MNLCFAKYPYFSIMGTKNVVEEKQIIFQHGENYVDSLAKTENKVSYKWHHHIYFSNSLPLVKE